MSALIYFYIRFVSVVDVFGLRPTGSAMCRLSVVPAVKAAVSEVDCCKTKTQSGVAGFKFE